MNTLDIRRIVDCPFTVWDIDSKFGRQKYMLGCMLTLNAEFPSVSASLHTTGAAQNCRCFHACPELRTREVVSNICIRYQAVILAFQCWLQHSCSELCLLSKLFLSMLLRSSLVDKPSKEDFSSRDTHTPIVGSSNIC